MPWRLLGLALQTLAPSERTNKRPDAFVALSERFCQSDGDALNDSSSAPHIHGRYEPKWQGWQRVTPPGVYGRGSKRPSPTSLAHSDSYLCCIAGVEWAESRRRLQYAFLQ